MTTDETKIQENREYELLEIVQLGLIPTIDTYTKAYGLVTAVMRTNDETNRFGYARTDKKRFKRIPREGDKLKIPYRLEKKFGDNQKYFIKGADIIDYNNRIQSK